MKIDRCNMAFRRLGQWQIKHSVSLLFSVLIVTLFSFMGLPNLIIQSGDSDFLEEGTQMAEATKLSENLFGNDMAVGGLVKTDDIFSKENLEKLSRLSSALLLNVPYARNVTSIVDSSVIYSEDDTLVIKSPFEDGIPSDEAELERIRKLFLSKPEFVDKLVNKDSSETFVILSLDPFPVALKGEPDPMLYTGRIALDVIESFNSKDFEIIPFGEPCLEVIEDMDLKRELFTSVSLAFLVMILLLIFFTRSLRGVVVPVLATGFGVGTVFGIMGHLGLTADNSMISLPIILGMAVSIGYSIHIINSFKRFYEDEKMSRKEAVLAAVFETGWPLLFTVITTVVSLLSFGTSGIYAVTWSGYTCAAMVLVTFLYVMILDPCLLIFGRTYYESNGKKPRTRKFFSFLPFYGSWVVKRSKIIIVVGLLLMLLLIPFLFFIEVNTDYQEMMGNRTMLGSKLKKLQESEIGAYMSYHILIEFPEEGDAYKVENLDSLEEFIKALGRQDSTKKVHGKAMVFSVLDILKQMHKSIMDDEEDFYSIPREQDVVDQLMFLYEISDPDSLYRFVSDDGKFLFVEANMSRYNQKELNRLLGAINMEGKLIFGSRAKVLPVGEVLQFSALSNLIVESEVKSFLFSLLFIAILLCIAFNSVKIGLIGLIPNIAPILTISALMSIFSLHLDMIMVMVMPMVLGIAVDDTIHFVNHAILWRERGKTPEEAIVHTFSEVGSSMIMTTIILCLEFLVFVPSRVASLSNIGLAAIVGLAFALISDYTLSPALFCNIRFGKKEVSYEKA